MCALTVRQHLVLWRALSCLLHNCLPQKSSRRIRVNQTTESQPNWLPPLFLTNTYEKMYLCKRQKTQVWINTPKVIILIIIVTLNYVSVICRLHVIQALRDNYCPLNYSFSLTEPTSCHYETRNNHSSFVLYNLSVNTHWILSDFFEFVSFYNFNGFYFAWLLAFVEKFPFLFIGKASLSRFEDF